MGRQRGLWREGWGLERTKGFIKRGKKQREKRGKEGMHVLENENERERQKQRTWKRTTPRAIQEAGSERRGTWMRSA